MAIGDLENFWEGFQETEEKKGVLHVVGTTLIGFIFFFSMFGW